MTINIHKVMKDFIEDRFNDRNAYQVSKNVAKLLEDKLRKLINEIMLESLEGLNVGQRILPKKVVSILDSRTTMARIWDNVMREDNVSNSNGNG